MFYLTCHACVLYIVVSPTETLSGALDVHFSHLLAS